MYPLDLVLACQLIIVCGDGKDRGELDDWILCALTASELARTSEPGDAIRRLREVLKASPRHLGALLTLRDLYADRGDWDGYEETLKRLENFLGIPLARITVRPESVGRWKTASGEYDFDFLQPALREHGYTPAAATARVADGGHGKRRRKR